MNKIIQGDSLILLAKATPNSIDAIVTDPPYGLSFMGKKWDYDVPSVDIWKECYRVLKPGGYLLSFAGTRTQHRMAVNIEDAGFEIRDMIAWVYGSGFPKSLNIGKAVDKMEGVELEQLPTIPMQEATEVGAISKNRRCAICLKAISSGNPCQCDRTYKAQNEWEGWGTALKPALEPITVARKPLSEKTVAENVLKWGTGGINIDGSRVGTGEDKTDGGTHGKIWGNGNKAEVDKTIGRFPANLIHDGSDEVVGLFPDSKSTGGTGNLSQGKMGNMNWEGQATGGFGDSGSAARFFYCAKASKADRDEGLDSFNEQVFSDRNPELDSADTPQKRSGNPKKNHHPTVKPTKLMQYLVKLVTPKGGTVLDPFMGSGSTGKACKLEGFDFIGIELDPEYCKIAETRINAVVQPIL